MPNWNFVYENASSNCVLCSGGQTVFAPIHWLIFVQNWIQDIQMFPTTIPNILIWVYQDKFYLCVVLVSGSGYQWTYIVSGYGYQWTYMVSGYGYQWTLLLLQQWSNIQFGKLISSLFRESEIKNLPAHLLCQWHLHSKVSLSQLGLRETFYSSFENLVDKLSQTSQSV